MPDDEPSESSNGVAVGRVLLAGLVDDPCEVVAADSTAPTFFWKAYLSSEYTLSGSRPS